VKFVVFLKMRNRLRQNLIEKIVQRFTVGGGNGGGASGGKHLPTVQSGQFVSIQPHHVMTHDNTAAVMLK
jgi:homoaconitate hydratase